MYTQVSFRLDLVMSLASRTIVMSSAGGMRINFMFVSQSSLFQTSSALSRELTEGTPTARHTQQGFGWLGRLKQGVTNLVTRQQDTSELSQDKDVDRYVLVLKVPHT